MKTEYNFSMTTIEVAFGQSEDPRNHFTLTYELHQNEFIQRWATAVQEALGNKRRILNGGNIYGSAFSVELDLRSKIDECVRIINSYQKGSITRALYPHMSHAFLRQLQDDLARFETMDQFRPPRAPAEVSWALSNVNIYIRQYKNLFAPSLSHVDILLTPVDRFDFAPDDYKLFTTKRQWGELLLVSDITDSFMCAMTLSFHDSWSLNDELAMGHISLGQLTTKISRDELFEKMKTQPKAWSVKVSNTKSMGKFCVLPWIHRFTNVGGEIQVCCTSEEKDNFIRENNSPLNAPQDFDTERIMNSKFMNSVRKSLLKGQWPDLCHRCKVTEESGGDSRRIVENRGYSGDVAHLLEQTNPDGSLKKVEVTSFDMRLGNTCNLACRMCNPRSSSKWAKDWKRIDQNHFVVSDDTMESYRHYNWYKNPKVGEEVQKLLPNLRHMHFAGGEPLLVPEMIQYLRAAVESGHSKNIELSYNTNLTVFPPELKKLWPNFRGVKLLCSIDAFGETNDYIRYPSKWKVIDNILRDIDLNFSDYGVTEALVMCTVQVYNIFKLPELYDYLALNFKNVKQLPHLIDLHHPSYYKTQVLPAKLKSLAEEKLSELLEVCEERIASGVIPSRQAYLLNSLKASINFMKMENHEELLADFKKSAESKDGFRKQSLYKLVPELVSL